MPLSKVVPLGRLDHGSRLIPYGRDKNHGHHGAVVVWWPVFGYPSTPGVTNCQV